MIDAFAKRENKGLMHPRPLTVAHETAVITMAHGYYLATGKPAAVMVHVGIGSANALAPLMAASRANIPVIFMADQIPLTDLGDTANLHRLVEAFGGYGEMVDRSEDLTPALDRALNEMINKGRQAVLNAMTAKK